MPKIKLTEAEKREWEYAAYKAIRAERRAKRKAERKSAKPCEICGAADAGAICMVCARG